MSAEPIGADHRREHARHLGQEFAAERVEIVGMLIVAEQHGIDGAR